MFEKKPAGTLHQTEKISFSDPFVGFYYGQSLLKQTAKLYTTEQTCVLTKSRIVLQ
jgi:hypothetical protein